MASILCMCCSVFVIASVLVLVLVDVPNHCPILFSHFILNGFFPSVFDHHIFSLLRTESKKQKAKSLTLCVLAFEVFSLLKYGTFCRRSTIGTVCYVVKNLLRKNKLSNDKKIFYFFFVPLSATSIILWKWLWFDTFSDNIHERWTCEIVVRYFSLFQSHNIFCHHVHLSTFPCDGKNSKHKHGAQLCIRCSINSYQRD